MTMTAGRPRFRHPLAIGEPSFYLSVIAHCLLTASSIAIGDPSVNRDPVNRSCVRSLRQGGREVRGGEDAQLVSGFNFGTRLVAAPASRLAHVHSHDDADDAEYRNQHPPPADRPNERQDREFNNRHRDQVLRCAFLARRHDPTRAQIETNETESGLYPVGVMLAGKRHSEPFEIRLPSCPCCEIRGRPVQVVVCHAGYVDPIPVHHPTQTPREAAVIVGETLADLDNFGPVAQPTHVDTERAQQTAATVCCPFDFERIQCSRHSQNPIARRPNRKRKCLRAGGCAHGGQNLGGGNLP